VVNKITLKAIVRGFLYLLLVSAVILIIFILPYSSSTQLASEGIEWWWISLSIILGIPIFVGLIMLSIWAFSNKEKSSGKQNGS